MNFLFLANISHKSFFATDQWKSNDMYPKGHYNRGDGEGGNTLHRAPILPSPSPRPRWSFIMVHHIVHHRPSSPIVAHHRPSSPIVAHHCIVHMVHSSVLFVVFGNVGEASGNKATNCANYYIVILMIMPFRVSPARLAPTDRWIINEKAMIRRGDGERVIPFLQ